MNWLSIVGEGNKKITRSWFASLSIPCSTRNDWKFNIPLIESIAQQILKGENTLLFGCFFAFSIRKSWHTPSLHDQTASDISVTDFLGNGMFCKNNVMCLYFAKKIFLLGFLRNNLYVHACLLVCWSLCVPVDCCHMVFVLICCIFAALNYTYCAVQFA